MSQRQGRKSNRPDFTTEAGIERRLAEHRGQGDGANYLPWMRVPEFSSRGYRVMTMSQKFGRVIHLFSWLEWMVFLLLEAADDIISLKEQFPLDRDETRALATALNVRHPRPYGTDVVVTTDLLVDIRQPNGTTKRRAVAVKYLKDLRDRRVVEKLQIEQSYHSQNDTEFVIMTERDVPRELVKNVTLVRVMLRRGSLSDVSLPAIADADAQMRPLLGKTSWGQMTVSCDTHLQLRPGTAARIARYLIATREWPVDLTYPLFTREPFRMLSL